MTHMQAEGFMRSADDYNLHVVNSPEELIQRLIDCDDFVTTC